MSHVKSRNLCRCGVQGLEATKCIIYRFTAKTSEREELNNGVLCSLLLKASKSFGRTTQQNTEAVQLLLTLRSSKDCSVLETVRRDVPREQLCNAMQPLGDCSSLPILRAQMRHMATSSSQILKG